MRFQQNSWYRTRGHKVELSKINENDNKTHILWQWKATNSQTHPSVAIITAYDIKSQQVMLIS